MLSPNFLVKTSMLLAPWVQDGMLGCVTVVNKGELFRRSSGRVDQERAAQVRGDLPYVSRQSDDHVDDRVLLLVDLEALEIVPRDAWGVVWPDEEGIDQNEGE